MTEEPDRDGRAIELIGPEPPHPIDPDLRDDVLDWRAHRGSRSRRWAVIGASVVAAAAVATVLLVNSSHSQVALTSATSSATSSTASPRLTRAATSSRVVPTPPVGTPVSGGVSNLRHLGHWPSTVLRAKVGAVTDMLMLNDDLYLIGDSSVQRVSAESGRVIGRMRLAVTPDSAVAADGALWLLMPDGGRLTLSEYSPTLRLVATVVLGPAVPREGATVVAAGRDGKVFFATDGANLFRIDRDPLRSTLIATAITPPILDLAVSANTLYVASGRVFHNVVDAYSVHGAHLEPEFGAAVGNVQVNDGLAISNDGVWLATSSGHASQVSVLAKSGHTLIDGSGTAALFGASVRVVGDTAWTSAYDVLICSDGSTGQQLAATSTTPVDSHFGAVSADGRYVYAYGQVERTRHVELVRIEVPAACTSD